MTLSTSNQSLVLAEPFIGPVPKNALRAKMFSPIADLEHHIQTLQLVDGSVFVQLLYFALDPHLKIQMRPAEGPSRAPLFTPDAPIFTYSVAKVLKSQNKDIPVGSNITGIFPVTKYNILTLEQLNYLDPAFVIDPKYNIDLPLWLGPGGMPGRTAYWALEHIAKGEKGEKIFISGACGAVGQLAGQLAKRLGLFVIGSTSSQEKASYLKEELGFDVVIDYSKQDILEELTKLAPIDIYFDNVGGKTLDDFFTVANKNARVIACGTISQYSNSKPEESYGLKNFFLVVMKSIKVEGLLSLDHIDERDDFIKTVAPLIASGEIKTKIDLVKGIENANDAFAKIFTSNSFGKTVIQVE